MPGTSATARKEKMLPTKETRGMTLIVKTVTRITLGFILLYGIYAALQGSVAPGGGFVGGVIIALSFVHIMLAFGKEVALKRLRAGRMRLITSIAALVFLYITTSAWHGNYEHIIIPLAEMCIVAAGLFSIFMALVLLSKADKEQ